MSVRIRYVAGIILIVVTLLLLFTGESVVHAIGAGDAFFGWLGKAPYQVGPVGDNLDMAVTVGLLVLLVYCGFGMLVFLLQRSGVLSRNASDQLWFWLGCLLVTAGVFVPFCLSGPEMAFYRESGVFSFILGPYNNHFVPNLGLPGFVPVLGIISLIIGTSRKTRAFEVSVGSFLLLVWLLLPVVRIVYPDFYFEGKPYEVFWPYALVYVIGLAFIYLVIPVLWPDVKKIQVVSQSVDDVSPARGQTVKAIAEGAVSHVGRKTFLFGAIDEETVRKWGMIGQALLAVASSRVKRLVSFAVCLLLWPVLLYTLSGGEAGAFDRDVDQMWGTRLGPDGTVVATRDAMIAARRVFRNDLQFHGLTGEQVRRKLGMERMDARYKLNKPIYAWEKDRFILRIGDGKDSYALNLAYNPSGTVAVVMCQKEKYPPVKSR